MFKYVFISFYLIFCLALKATDKLDKLDKLDELRQGLRPVDLNFEALKSKIDKYMESIGIEKAKEESLRLRYITNLKKSIIKRLNKSPYNGFIFLQKKVIMAEISQANEEHITIKTSKGQSVDVAWGKLSMRQYGEFFSFYAYQLGKEMKLGDDKSSRTKFNKIANMYFAGALLYDWYGFKNTAARMTTKALLMNPDLKNKHLIIAETLI